MTDPISRVTTFGYDDLGSQTSMTDNLGHASQTVYDALGNVRGQIDAQGNTSRYMVDLLSRQTAAIDPLGGETNFAYDAVGNRLSLTDPMGNVTAWTYDGLNRQLTDTNHLGGVRTFAYDAASNLVSRTDRNGRVIEWDYDALNRATQETWLEGATVVNTITSEFDAASQLTDISDNFSAYSYTLDALGRATGISQSFVGFVPFVVHFSQSFDAASNRTGLSASIGSTADFTNAYQFDALNRMTRVTQTAQGSGSGLNSVAEKRVDLAYNAIGEFTSIHRYSDLVGSNVVANSTFGYDALARLTSLAHQRADNSSINTFTWAFDSLNRIDVFSSADGTTDFDYDVTSQLTSANHSYQTDENYNYDANGNRVENGQVTGTENRLLNDGTYTYEYDLEGNRAKRTEIATAQYVQYVWDHRNRLTEVLFKSAANLLGKEVEYTYDVFDHRIGKRVDDNGDGVFDRAEAYVWDGLDVVLDFVDTDGDGAADYELATRRLFGAAVDQVLAEENAATSAVDWLLADNQGTIRDVVDSAGQLLSGGHFVYDSFGRILAGDFSLIHHLFTAQEYDVDIGHYFFNARWYDAVTHLFISADPLRDGDNWYAYVGNNSPNATDPSGLASPTGQWWNDDWTDWLNIYAWSAAAGDAAVRGTFGYTSDWNNAELERDSARFRIASAQDNIAYRGANTATYVEAHRNTQATIGVCKTAGEAYITYEAVIFGGSAVRENPNIVRIARERSREGIEVAEGAFRANGSRGVWDLNPTTRGTIIEQRLGQNLPGNFPVIDRFQGGLATSIKSMDLGAATYADAGVIRSTARAYINEVAAFEGARLGRTVVSGSNITGRALDLVVPPGATQAQRQVLAELVSYGVQKGVTVRVVEMQ